MKNNYRKRQKQLKDRNIRRYSKFKGIYGDRSRKRPPISGEEFTGIGNRELRLLNGNLNLLEDCLEKIV